jgi:hypothetical protein
MTRLVSFVALAAALVAPGDVLAQPPPPPPPLAPSVAEGLPPTVTLTLPSCRLADHAGFDEADSHTAGQLVCAQIAHAGASPADHYRVSLGKLGSIVILSVAREGSTVGSTVDSREMRLQGIEEVEIAAPRIAESIVRGTPLPETEKVDNLVGGETRQPKTKPGKTHFALGLAGLFPPLDQSLGPAPGVVLDIHYETGDGRFELGGAFRAGGGQTSSNSPGMGFVMFSVGGRYFTSDADISPYVGGGLNYEYLNLSLPGEQLQGSNSGLGAYVDAGAEILRTHHTHLALGGRLDLPFFALNTSSTAPSNPATMPSTSTSSQKTFYYAPLSLELRLTF